MYFSWRKKDENIKNNYCHTDFGKKSLMPISIIVFIIVDMTITTDGKMGIPNYY